MAGGLKRKRNDEGYRGSVGIMLAQPFNQSSESVALWINVVIEIANPESLTTITENERLALMSS